MRRVLIFVVQENLCQGLVLSIQIIGVFSLDKVLVTLIFYFICSGHTMICRPLLSAMDSCALY